MPLPIGQLDAAARPRPAQDLKGETEREPEGKDIEAEDPRENLADPVGALSGKISRGERNEKRVDEEKTAQENFGQPMRVG